LQPCIRKTNLRYIPFTVRHRRKEYPIDRPLSVGQIGKHVSLSQSERRTSCPHRVIGTCLEIAL
jgi:hypothetical protein